MTTPIIIQSSFPITFECTDICTTLIRSKLAACIHKTSPITSFYSWKNELCSDEEYLLLIKTSLDHIDAISQLLIEKHPYEVPEIIQLPINNMNASYLNWYQSAIDNRS